MINTDGFIHVNAHLNPKKYLLLITNKWLRDTLAKFRLRVCGLKNRKNWFITREEGDLTCPMYGQANEDEVHFLFQCQAYANLRKRNLDFCVRGTH